MPHRIIHELEDDKYLQASSIAVVMRVSSFALLLLHLTQSWFVRERMA